MHVIVRNNVFSFAHFMRLMSQKTVRGKLPHHTDKETFCVNTTKTITTRNEDRLASECIGDDYDIIKSPSGHTSNEQQASYMSSYFTSHNAALCCYFKSDFSVRQSLENNDSGINA